MLELKFYEGANAKLHTGTQRLASVEPELHSNFRCQVDGSWIANWEGGIGFIAWKGSSLLEAKSEGVHACAPIHAEAIAMSEAVKYVKSTGIT